MRQKTTTTKDSQPLSPNGAFDANRKKSASLATGKTVGEDIIELILNDHVPLKALIETLKDEEGTRATKAPSFEEFAYLLTCHAKAEEQALYVAMKNVKSLIVPSFEGDTEHAIADQLVHEINASPDDNEWLAKVKVLAESVEHHIEEEEEEMLKKIEKDMPEDLRMNLGQEYVRLIEEYRFLYHIDPPKMVQFKKTPLPPVTTLQ